MKVLSLLETADPNAEDAPKRSLEKVEPAELIRDLDRNKALLIQSDEKTGPFTLEDFGALVAGLKLEKYEYVGGAAPRKVIPVAAGDDIVFTANEAPPDAAIPFHHELAQSANPPAYIFFFCDEPAEVGGETALIDSTLVYRYVQDNFPDFMENFLGGIFTLFCK